MAPGAGVRPTARGAGAGQQPQRFVLSRWQLQRARPAAPRGLMATLCCGPAVRVGCGSAAAGRRVGETAAAAARRRRARSRRSRLAAAAAGGGGGGGKGKGSKKAGKAVVTYVYGLRRLPGQPEPESELVSEWCCVVACGSFVSRVADAALR